MNRIKCKARECEYNHNCDCMAESIEVCNCGCKEAHHPDETECSTFKKRDM